MAATLQRVVLPEHADPVLLPLYVEGPYEGPSVERSSGQALPPPGLVLGRHRLRVPAGQRVSFASYVNAFPASYWQRWTSVREVRLELELDGPATVEVYRSDSTGKHQRFRRQARRSAGRVELQLPLAGFDAGGWYWFEVLAGGADVEVSAGRWAAEADAGATASVGITTFDRVDQCSALLAQLAADPELLDVLDDVYVVDQGGERLAEVPAMAGPTAALGERLHIIEQANLGGSGGFARAQLETLDAGRSDFVLLLDDDVSIDPELLRRAVVFAGLCTTATIVGMQMLSASRPTELHATGERVEPRRFWWRPTDPVHRDHDLAAAGLRNAGWLHRRDDVDYNGWWGCLIPVAVLAGIGLSMPMFLKWDDAEYGLRAAAAGYPTVTLPGAGVWHVTWWDKGDAVGWQAYFHQRNRVVAALLHSPYSHGGVLVPELMAHQVKHLAAMQYAAAAMRGQGVCDVLAGPDALADSLATALPGVRRLQETFPDAEVRPAPPDLSPTPQAGRARPSRPALVATAARGLVRQLRREAARSAAQPGGPDAVLRHDEASWWRLLCYDSAVVATADGTGSVSYRRSRRTFLQMLRDNVEVHWRLRREWPGLAARYRAALPGLTSPERWRETFEKAGRRPA
jgi:galactofuranosylgalactofuranosylrhamnosyl-N-acetylglucosaminyl-diphospho-decaprenol beta-1,5/1,6-galactofuranosyltransferase